MRNNERILVIRNPGSGKIKKDSAIPAILGKIRNHFKSVSLINSSSPSHGYEIAKRGLEDFDIIVAFGGDGTINSVASALINTDKILGIIPGGSGNGLARNLKIPLSQKEAADVLIKGNDVYLDAGKINDNYFFNVAGIGLDAYISKKFNRKSKSRGIFPYVYYAFEGYFKFPSFKVRVKLGNKEFSDRVMVITLANFRQYGGNAIIAPFASPFDKLLDMCMVRRFNLFTESSIILRVFTGKIYKSSYYRSFRFKEVEIKSLEGKVPFHFDGECGGRDLTDFRIKVLPGKIRVRTPWNEG